MNHLERAGIMTLSSALVAKHLLLSSEVSAQKIRKIAIIDGVYGVSAVVVFFAGLSLWLWVGKPAIFYSGNWIFHVKISIFSLVALLSIYPTIFFFKNRNSSSEKIKIPKIIIKLIRIELLLLMVLPFLAVLMSQGFGGKQ
jgi:putative membrane protein